MSIRADVASGKTGEYAVDLRLPGYIPLELARTYASDVEQGEYYGPGWRFNLNISLHLGNDRLVFSSGGEEEIVFTPIDVKVQAWHQDSGLILQHHPDVYVAFFSPALQLVFPKQNAYRGTIALDRIEDLNGNHIQFAYRQGRLVTIADTVGRKITLGYTGNTISSLDVTGQTGQKPVRARAFEYDYQGRLIAVHDQLNRTIHYDYKKHYVVARRDRAGAVRYAQYDADGRCRMLWDEHGSEAVRIDFDDLRQRTRLTKIDGSTQIYQHVYSRLILNMTDPHADQRAFYYDEQENIIGFTNRFGSIVTVQKEEDDVLNQVDGEERLALVAYNEEGFAGRVEDAYENTFILAYDAESNLVEITDPEGQAWHISRDGRGRVTHLQTPEGRNVQRLQHEGSDVLEDDLGLVWKRQRDLFGRLCAISDAAGRKITLERDAAGHVKKLQIGDAYTAEFSYNPAGRLTTFADSEGRQSQRRYDSAMRLVDWRLTDGTQRRFTYDAANRLAAIVKGRKGSTEMSYDQAGRLVEIGFADGSHRAYRYTDDAVIVENDSNAKTRNYNPLGELTHVAGTNGSETDVSFGPTGELISFESEGTEHFFTYDTLGRVAEWDLNGATVGFGYDADGCVRSVDSERGSWSLTADERGRPMRIVSEEAMSTVDLSYDATSRLQTLAVAGSTIARISYDDLDRVTRIDLPAEGQSVDIATGSGEESQLIDVSIPAQGDADSAASFALFAGPNGISVGIRVDGRVIPFWIQGTLLRSTNLSLQQAIIVSAIRGMESLVSTQESLDRALLERWASPGPRELWFTSIPDLPDTPPWNFFHCFFLHPGFLHRHRLGIVPHLFEAGRSNYCVGPSSLVTGSHDPSGLNPVSWQERSLSRRLGLQSPLFAPGRIDPEEAVKLFSSSAAHQP